MISPPFLVVVEQFELRFDGHDLKRGLARARSEVPLPRFLWHTSCVEPGFNVGDPVAHKRPRKADLAGAIAALCRDL